MNNSNDFLKVKEKRKKWREINKISNFLFFTAYILYPLPIIILIDNKTILYLKPFNDFTLTL